jgi:hypothetical protein
MRLVYLFLIFILALPRHLYAGMPVNPITFRVDVLYTYRIQALSFFVVASFLLAWAVQKLWNSLTTDFPRLPRLTYFKSLALVLLWGLLLAMILNMTTAARELMTPGAWERSGQGYTLTPSAPPTDETRKARIQTVADALLAHAKNHQGKFPAALDLLPLNASDLTVSPSSNTRYIYLTGHLLTTQYPSLLLCEPDDTDPKGRYCLTTDGSIKKLSFLEMVDSIHPSVPQEGVK